MAGTLVIEQQPPRHEAKFRRRAQDIAHLAVRSLCSPFAVVVAVNASLLWFFYDSFWCAADEGNYAHIAQRVLSGEVLNLHVQDIHPGYINFLNAAALSIFGPDLLSLRYPLVIVSLLQSCLVFLLFRHHGRWMAATAAVSLTSLGFIQFLNPTANWYCLFLLIVTACCLKWLPKGSGLRLVCVGFVVVSLGLFRQLSGAFLAAGVMCYLLIEARRAARGSSLLLERTVIALMAGGLLIYLRKATDAMGFLLFGVWPLVVLIWLWFKTSAGNREVLRIIALLWTGGLLAASPLLLYHVVHGSVSAWFNDTVLTAVSLPRLDFFELRFYSLFIHAGLRQALSARSAAELLNGLYWFFLPLISALNAIVVLKTLLRPREGEQAAVDALPLLAVFYAVVSVHFQIPIYLYYTAGLSLACLVMAAPGKSPRLRYGLLSLALLLSSVSVYYHAGQPLSRRIIGILEGRRVTLSDSGALDRAGIRIEASDREGYAALISLIQSEVKPDETIFALPSNAELYFLSNRKNPFRFYNTALGVRSASDLEGVMRTLEQEPPKLITYNANDKYNTHYSVQIVELVRRKYRFLGEINGLEVYLLSNDSQQASAVVRYINGHQHDTQEVP